MMIDAPQRQSRTRPGGTAHLDVFVTSDGKKGRMIRTDAGAMGVRTFEQ